MVRWPWRRDGGNSADASDADAADSAGGTDTGATAPPDGTDTGTDPPGGIDVEPVVSCSFQDGSLFVYDDHVHVDRDGRSRFGAKSIPIDEITDVVYEKGITIGYLQIRQAGFESDDAGLLSDPIDENTLHFQRNRRACATDARDAIRARLRG